MIIAPLIGLLATGVGFLTLAISMVAIHAFTSSECNSEFNQGTHSTKAPGLGYFSSSYTNAREKFLDATRVAGVQVESIQSPQFGPHNEPLFTDVAFIGPKNASTVLVLSSGVHGVEGFAGSGIQTGLLHEEITTRMPQDMAILMIHAVNPYGMAYLRRFNEDNIDLNRNFVDHAESYPSNEGYQILAGFIAPKSLSPWENMKARLGFLWYGLIHGKTRLQHAISGGQYDYPKGLFFGGREETWSNRNMRNIIRRYLAQARHVILVDIHTGLGPYAAPELIISEEENSPAHRRALHWWGTLVKNTLSGDSASTSVKGPLKTAFVQLLPATEVTAVSLEFGTYPAKDVFWALRAENWRHHYSGQDLYKAKEIKSCLLRIFRPNSAEWEVSVWNQGKEVIYQVLQQLSQKEMPGMQG